MWLYPWVRAETDTSQPKTIVVDPRRGFGHGRHLPRHASQDDLVDRPVPLLDYHALRAHLARPLQRVLDGPVPGAKPIDQAPRDFTDAHFPSLVTWDDNSFAWFWYAEKSSEAFLNGRYKLGDVGRVVFRPFLAEGVAVLGRPAGRTARIHRTPCSARRAGTHHDTRTAWLGCPSARRLTRRSPPALRWRARARCGSGP
jgi:hypothetical protein